MPIVNRPTRSLSTQVVHGGRAPSAGEPVVTPLVQSVNYVEEVGTSEGLRYPRYGNVPNAEHVQRRLAALEGAEAALLLGSGMGALACGMLFFGCAFDLALQPTRTRARRVFLASLVYLPIVLGTMPLDQLS